MDSSAAIGQNENINIWLNQINSEFKSAISVDCVIFGYDQNSLKVLLGRSDMPPYVDKYSLIGDLLHPNETLDEAALRVLEEKTGLQNVYLRQVKNFSKLDRHPLGRVITVAYNSLVNISECKINPKDSEVFWVDINDISDMAFDHLEILMDCLNDIRIKIREKPIGFDLLPEKFTISALQKFYEIILGITLDKRNFRRKLKSLKLLIEVGEIQKDVAHRPAQLYKFDKNLYEQKRKEGFNFEL